MFEWHCATEERIQEVLSNTKSTEKMAVLFKACSEPVRVQILLSMLQGEICVHDLCVLLNLAQPRISNHLRILKQGDLIKSRKDKNHIYYSLADSHVADILHIGMLHVNHNHNEEEL